MKISQTTNFKRNYKKLLKNQITPVNQAIKDICENPTLGEEKKGDLVGIRVHKFKILNQQFLLAYEADSEEIILLALGVHENFYKNLKN